MIFDVAPQILALLLGAAFVAGFVDAIAGGGGLITVPSLLLAGADPLTALATNKLQGLFGAGAAARSYARVQLVAPSRLLWPALVAFVSAMAGARLASALPLDLIRAGLPLLLIGIALFFAFKPGLDDIDRTERLAPRVFALTVVPLVGFYDGLLGPGAGAFYMLGHVALAGFGILRATAATKFLNLASNLGGFVVLAVVASPWWMTGLAMALAQIAGASLGSRLAMRIGARVIKPVLIATSTLLALRLLAEAW